MAISEFEQAIDIHNIQGIYMTDYGIKHDYVFSGMTLKEYTDACTSIQSQLDLAFNQIKSTQVIDSLQDLKADLVNLISKKHILLTEQMEAIEIGGKWQIELNHGSDVNLMGVLEHYGNNQDLIQKIKDHNETITQFIDKYNTTELQSLLIIN